MFIMSNHALERAVDMAVEGDEIRDCMERPRQVHPAGADADYYTRGRITLVVSRSAGVVKTVLWARASDWVKDRQFESYGRAEEGLLDGVRSARKQRQKQRKGYRNT